MAQNSQLLKTVKRFETPVAVSENFRYFSTETLKNLKMPEENLFFQVFFYIRMCVGYGEAREEVFCSSVIRLVCDGNKHHFFLF